MNVPILKRNIALFLALGCLVASPLIAQDDPLCIPPGTDLWTTGGTGTSVVQTLPANFFCPGSPALTLDIQLRGEALMPGTALGSTDTVVQRFDDVCLEIGEEGQTSVAVRALCLVGTSALSIPNCGAWEVTATTSSTDDPERQIEEIQSGKVVSPLTIFRTHEQGGIFLSSLVVSARLTFRQAGTTHELETLVEFDQVTGTWATAPGPGGILVADFDLDVLCSGVTVLVSDLPSNDTNFHPGWDSSGVAVPVSHRGDDESHLVDPIRPPDPCTREVVQLLGEAAIGPIHTQTAAENQGLEVPTWPELLTIDGQSETSLGRRLGILVPCRFATEEVDQVIVPEGGLSTVLTVQPVGGGTTNQ